MVFSEMIGVSADIDRHHLSFGHVAVQLGHTMLGILLTPLGCGRGHCLHCDFKSKPFMGLIREPS